MAIILLLTLMAFLYLTYFNIYQYKKNTFIQEGFKNRLSNLFWIKKEDEDDDMKIFVGKNSDNNTYTSSVIEYKVEKERENGNLRKAKFLGINLATEVINFDECEDSEDENTKLHKKMLYAFIIKRSMRKHITSDLLYDTANSCFLITLMETDEEFYDNLQTTGSFSRYQLIDRDTRTTEKDFGKAFAKLLHHEDEAKWIEKGENFFKKWNKHIKNIIINVDFE